MNVIDLHRQGQTIGILLFYFNSKRLDLEPYILTCICALTKKLICLNSTQITLLSFIFKSRLSGFYCFHSIINHQKLCLIDCFQLSRWNSVFPNVVAFLFFFAEHSHTIDITTSSSRRLRCTGCKTSKSSHAHSSNLILFSSRHLRQKKPNHVEITSSVPHGIHPRYRIDVMESLWTTNPCHQNLSVFASATLSTRTGRPFTTMCSNYTLVIIYWALLPFAAMTEVYYIPAVMRRVYIWDGYCTSKPIC